MKQKKKNILILLIIILILNSIQPLTSVRTLEDNTYTININDIRTKENIEKNPIKYYTLKTYESKELKEVKSRFIKIFKNGSLKGFNKQIKISKNELTNNEVSNLFLELKNNEDFLISNVIIEKQINKNEINFNIKDEEHNNKITYFRNNNNNINTLLKNTEELFLKNVLEENKTRIENNKDLSYLNNISNDIKINDISWNNKLKKPITSNNRLYSELFFDIETKSSKEIKSGDYFIIELPDIIYKHTNNIDFLDSDYFLNDYTYKTLEGEEFKIIYILDYKTNNLYGYVDIPENNTKPLNYFNITKTENFWELDYKKVTKSQELVLNYKLGSQEVVQKQDLKFNNLKEKDIIFRFNRSSRKTTGSNYMYEFSINTNNIEKLETGKTQLQVNTNGYRGEETIISDFVFTDKINKDNFKLYEVDFIEDGYYVKNKKEIDYKIIKDSERTRTIEFDVVKGKIYFVELILHSEISSDFDKGIFLHLDNVKGGSTTNALKRRHTINTSSGGNTGNTIRNDFKDFKVVKNWLGFKEEEIIVDLYRNDRVLETVILNNTNNWEYIFKDIEVFYNSKNESIYSYSIKEREIPNYISKTEVQENKDLTVYKITNKFKPYEFNLEFKKIDANTKKGLSGAEFEIYALDENNRNIDFKLKGVSDETGKIRIANIPYNETWKYFVKETKAPNNYRLNDTEFEIDTSVINYDNIEVKTDLKIENYKIEDYDIVDTGSIATIVPTLIVIIFIIGSFTIKKKNK